MLLESKRKIEEMESCLLSCPHPKLTNRERNSIIA